MRESSDVVIVGAGLAGMSVAVMLSALTDWSITLLEQRPLTLSEQPDRNSRPISLSHATVSILKALGVWDSVVEHGSPLSRVLVTEAGAFGAVHFLPDDWSLPALGYVVPIDYIVHGLMGKMDGSRIKLVTNARLTQLEQQDYGAALTWESGKRDVHHLEARCLIAADGAHSSVRSLLGIPTKATGSPVTITVSECVCDEPHQGQAEQRFVPGYGVLASVPLFEPNKIRVIWTRTADDAGDEFDQQHGAFARWCREQFRGRFSIQSIERQGQYSITPQSAERVCQGSVVLLGDAARTIPPIAAQGFNASLSDAAALVETMLQAHKTLAGSWGEPETLVRYAAWRHQSNERLPQFLRASQQLFSCPLPGLSSLRSGALMMLDSVPSLRRALGRRLLGLAGRVPALARGVRLDELEGSLLCDDQ